MNPSGSLRVLVVDDESLICDVIQNELEILGHRVVGRAPDGHRAVELAQTLSPELVLMDIEMPEMDGLDATRQIQQSTPCPVVLLTAHDDEAIVDRASRVGAAAYLLKPPEAQELGRTIRLAVARHADLMELKRVNAELTKALAEVKRLSGLLPICSYCKRIRDDNGYWQRVETYIEEHSEARFSHGLCMECARKHYPDVVGDMYPNDTKS